MHRPVSTSNGVAASPTLAGLPPLDHARSSGAGLVELVRISLERLAANRVRALLTMLGVIIGVASVVTLLAVGSGASEAITGQVRRLGSNLLTIMPGSPQNRGPGASGTAATLTMGDANAVAALGLPVAGIAPPSTAATRRSWRPRRTSPPRASARRRRTHR